MSNFRLLTSSLRGRTALYFGLGVASIILSTLFITRWFFLYSLDELENHEINQANHQAQSVIDMMIGQQDMAAYDWAYWDETYHLFVSDDLIGYRERNLTQDSLDNLGIDMMAFVSLNGELVDSLLRPDPEVTSTDLVAQVVAAPRVQEHFHEMLTRVDSRRESLAGLLLLRDQLWVVSLTPVRNSEGTSAISGWLIWGQNLTQRFPGNFRAILTADNQLVLPRQSRERLLTHPSNQSAQGVERTETLLVKWSPIIDMSGQNVAYLKTTLERVHYLKGQSLFLYLFVVTGFFAGLIGLVTFLMFRQRVSMRFTRFEQSMLQLFDKYQLNDLSHRRSDELERITQLVEILAENTSLTQDKLHDTLQKFDALYQSRSLGLLLVVDRLIVDINQAALDLLGYQKADLINQDLNILCQQDEDQAQCRVEQMYRSLESGVTQFEAALFNKQGKEIECLLDVNLIHHENQQALMLSISDVSEQKKQLKMINDLVGRDPVSGLYNRPTILSTLSELIEHKPKQFSFFYISVARLKKISEVYGHLIFDDTIRYIASVFGDKLAAFQVGRISEFEFIVVLEDLKQSDEAILCAHHFIDVMSRKPRILGVELDLSCKVAMVSPEITHHDLGYLLQAASYAVQHFPQAAPNEVINITTVLAEQAQSRLLINRDLAKAIRDKSIVAYYQPIVDTESGKVSGFEALARWLHPELGFVPPDLFIGVAEQNHLIVALGESVLRQACRFLADLNQRRTDHGLGPLSIHVNFSAIHFYHAQLPDLLSQVMDEFGIEQGQLVIEITESTLLGIESETLERTRAIKSLGIQLALDDFGTGYSSFSTLCNFPLDIVKLDKSYIDQIESNDRARTLIRSIAGMAQELGLTTVAEGVESASQLRKLKIWHIDEIQGYYFYKPMTESAALETFCHQ